ncbi:sigma-70 family RNA polymerase sigma factor [Rossellomorea aquimaris]|uniref:RNA polymerase sigma factor (Sigma-70 family) n=1 Tax=Rossellomorea aquimaris TaxID=189382 RepID=A0A366EKS8_9BACI|nr:sigma-70 family RNA polymerase sigma factor [Rossellomorea aquimaris]RBP03001.1 RNA polymerase sigma factor (sigma-70 family) [Rossellomorea aquimaris]
MNTSQTAPLLISRVREKDLEMVMEWFLQRKQSFYALGRIYVSKQEDIEDIFYRSIISIHNELHRFKKDTSFESWAISHFIHSARDLSKDKSFRDSESQKSDQTLCHAFHQLEDQEKEATALTYFNECSFEEVGRILEVSVEKVKSCVFSGIRKLREELGYGSFEGCPEYHKHYLDYLGRTMDRPEKVEFEMHIYHCQCCQEDLASFQEVVLTLAGMTEALEVPAGLIERVKSKVEEREARRQRKKKKRKSIWLSIAGVFAMVVSIGFVTGGFSSLYYAWTEEDEQLRAILQHDLGERLNLEAESNGVKITIRSVVADDVQTLVFYEIEDTEKDNRYMMNAHEGVHIENEYDVMRRDVQYMFYSPPVNQDEMQNEEKNVYKGTISLLPVSVDSGTIKMNVARLMQIVQDPKKDGGYRGEMTFAEGDWSFDIPFTKQSSRVHKLDKEIDIDGIQVRLDKLTVAPTTTLLQYSFQNQGNDKRIDVITFDALQTDNKKVEADLFGSNMYVESFDQEGWSAFTSSFDTLYFDHPKEVNIQFDSIHLSVDDRKTIELDAAKDMPQTFEYLGNNITIDEIKVGNPAKVILTHDVSKDRAYERVNYGFSSDHLRNENISMGVSDTDGVLMDKTGKVHKIDAYEYDQIDQPRYFETIQTIEFYNDSSREDVTPTKLEIEGYSTTKYVDDRVKVKLD